MKLIVKISRIVICVVACLYTLLACYHAAQHVRLECYKITPVGEGYAMGACSITAEAWFYIISGVVLLASGVVTVVFLFRRGIAAAVTASAATLISSIYGMCLNTMLSEVTLWREIARIFKIYGTDMIYLSIKNILALLCILVALCYAVLYIITYKKSSTEEVDENEQNS